MKDLSSARLWAGSGISALATCVGAAVAVPVLFYDPAAPAADPKRTLGLLASVVLLAAAVTRRPRARARVRVAPSALLFCGFVAWSALSLLWGVPSGARDLGSWTAGACLVLVTQRWPVRRARAAAGWAALIAGGGAGAIAVFQVALGARGLFVHGGQGNANWLGLLLAVTMPMTLGLFGRGARRPAAASLILQVAGLVLSHSRVAWAAALITTVPLAATMAWPSIRPRRAAGAGAVVVFALLASAAVRVSASPSPEPAGDVPIPLAFRGRTWIWETSAGAAAAALPVGAGLGGFAHAYLDAQGKRLSRLPPKEASRAFVNATTAHCDWLEVLVDSGPPALLLLALAVFGGAVAAVRARSRWLGGGAALLALAICAMGDSPLRQPGIVLVLGLVIGACPRTVTVSMPGLARAARWAMLAAAALLLARAARGWASDRRLTAARDAAPDEQRALLASAVRIDPSSGEALLEQGLRALDAGRPEEALDALRRSRPLLANVGTDIAIGNAEVVLGHAEAAITAYEAALSRSPGSFRAHANISQPLVARGRLDEAEGHLAVAGELWPGNPHLLEMVDRVQRARVEREAPLSPQPLPSTPAPEETALDFRGHVGSLPVVVRLVRAADVVRGSYFYEPRATDLAITGTVADRHLVLEEKSGDRVTGAFALDLDASGALRGTWSSPAGAKRLRVELDPEPAAR